MDREEKARANAFNSRIEALQRSSRRFENTAGAEIKLKEQKESDRTLAAMEKESIEREKRERETKETRRMEYMRSQDFNGHMMELKRQEQQRIAEERRTIRLRDEAVAASAAQQEKESRLNRVQQRALFKEQLDEQVKSKALKNKSDDFELSHVELQLNQSLVSLVNNSPQLLSKVKDRVNEHHCH